MIRKVRLDELSQIWDVLRDDISVIGLRLNRAQFVDDFNTRIRYHTFATLCRTGLTGWTQLRYTYGTSLEDAEES